MKARKNSVEFSLLDSPLYRLGRRLCLYSNITNTTMPGIALGVLLWGVLVSLAYFEGVSDRLFSLSVISAHVRLLLSFRCSSCANQHWIHGVRSLSEQSCVRGL